MADPSFAPPVSAISDIPNTAQPIAGLGLTLGVNGVLPSSVLAPSPSDGQALTYSASTGASAWGSVSPTLAQLRTLGAVTVYDRATTTVDVNTTVTETSLYTKTITGNDMSTNKMLRLSLRGDVLYNNGAANTITLRVKFGGTTFLAETLTSDVIGAARQPWWVNVEVSNLGATNSQMIEAFIRTIRPDESAPVLGIGHAMIAQSVGQKEGGLLGISTLGTIDTTTNKTLDVTVQWGTSSANNSWRMRYAVLELV